MKGFMNTLLSFQGPHTSGNLESRNKIRSLSNKQTGSRVHARDDNYNDRSRIETLRDDGKTTGGRTANTVQIAPSGFTLIELLVVVLIIGILAAMALPDYQRAVEVSRVGAALAYSKAFRDSVDRYYMAHNRFPASPDVLDIGLTECPKYFRCVYGYLAAEGKLEMWRQNGPFEYGLFTRSTLSPYQPGSIYCIASRKKTQGIEFCQHWGEADASPSEPNWFSVLVQ